MKSVARLIFPAAITAAMVIGFQQTLSAQTTSSLKDATADMIERQWIKLSPTGAMASFEMPEKPRSIERKFSPIRNRPPIKVRLHLCTVDEGKTTFGFGYHDLHETPHDVTTIKKSLDGAVQGMIANVWGRLMDASEIGMQSNPLSIKYAKHFGREFVYRFARNEKPFVVAARVYIVDGRQYQMYCIMDEEIYSKDLALKFLDSFRVNVPESDLPPRPRDPK